MKMMLALVPDLPLQPAELFQIYSMQRMCLQKRKLVVYLDSARTSRAIKEADVPAEPGRTGGTACRFLRLSARRKLTPSE